MTPTVWTSMMLALTIAANSGPPPDSEARREASSRFHKGVALYQAGDVQVALIEFRRAYELAPAHQLLFNIGQAAAELNDYLPAHAAFTRYLADGGDAIEPERVAAVQAELDRLATFIAYVRVDADVEGADVEIDGRSVGRTPIVDPIAVNAGSRHVVVNLAGHQTWSQRLELAGEDSASLTAVLSPLAPPPSGAGARATMPTDMLPPAATDRVFGRGFWAGLTITVLAGGGATALGVITLQEQRDHDLLVDTKPNNLVTIGDSADRIRRFALYTDVALGVTAVSAITTIAITAARSRKIRRQRGTDVDLGIGPRGVVLRGRF